MRKTLIGFTLVFVVGCGPNLESGKLPDGSMATVHDKKEPMIPVDLDNQQSGMVAVGIKVLVVSDEEPGDEYRKVRINIQEGQYQKRAAVISRMYLRPAK